MLELLCMVANKAMKSLKMKPQPVSNSQTKLVPRKESLKILMVATEAAPFVTVGGSSAVMQHLSKALNHRGHDARIFIPKFGFIDEEKYNISTIYEGLKVPTDDESTPYLYCNIKSATAPNGVQIYFLENREYFEKRANVYNYSDDSTRFALLSRGALEFIRTGIFVPDIVHCNDWHTGVLPNYLKTNYKKDPILSKVSTIFTIHNLAYQGMFDYRHASELDYDDGKSAIAPFFSHRIDTQHFMKRGILFADAVNTVSKAYSKEILTSEFGEGLDKLLLELKGKLFGIVNGLDYENLNPLTDTLIERNYDLDSLEQRAENKKALQKEYELAVRPDVLLLGFVGRVDSQKGVDMMVRVLRHILKNYDMQFVQVGGGDWGLTEMLKGLQSDFPQKVGLHPFPNFTLPRLLFAGTDCMLLPSRFEPCGIVQIESMRYGSIPIVRNVGGHSDTVEDFNTQTLKGTGFVFDEFDEFSLYGQIVRANEIYKNKVIWRRIQKNAMEVDFSWDYSAAEYEKLYYKSQLLKTRKNPWERSLDDVPR